MGYHENYTVDIVIYDQNGNKLVDQRETSYDITPGQYRWGDIRSRQFHYITSFDVPFSTSQDLTVRFFASPYPDEIDTTFLSCLVPSGLGYRPGDTTGRKLKISGVVGSDRPNDVYLNPEGTSYLASPGGVERGWSVVTGSSFHTGVDQYSDDWNWHSGSEDNGKPFYEVMGGNVIFTGTMYENGEPIADPNDAWLGDQIIVYNEQAEMAVRYAHLSSIDVQEVTEDCRVNLADCQNIHIGQAIGKVGNTGRDVTAYHLHITLYKNIGTAELSNLRNGRWPQGNSISGGSNYKATFKYIGDK